MTPLERIYSDLGRPKWFWPVILFTLLLLWGFAGWVAYD